MTNGKIEIKPMKKISGFKTFLIVSGLIAFSAKLSILYIPTETINPKNTKPAPVTSVESDGLSLDAPILKLFEYGPSALLYPITLTTVFKETTRAEEMTITIPMEYFKATPKNPLEFEQQQIQIRQFISDELTKLQRPDITTSIGGKDLARSIPEEQKAGSFNFTSLSVTGTASPETEGVGIEDELRTNQELANQRADYVKTAMKSLVNKVKEVPIKVEGVVIPLSEAEKAQILQFAKANNIKGTETEAILHIAKLINNPEPSSIKVPKKIIEIFTSKRKVEITIAGENVSKSITIWGFPSIIIALPFLIWIYFHNRKIENELKKQKEGENI
jgi:hypothetical protein